VLTELGGVHRSGGLIREAGIGAVVVMRRIAALGMVALGVWLILLIPIFSLFSRTSDADYVTGKFRPIFTPAYIAQLKRDYSDIRGLGLQFIGQTRPYLAEQLGVSQDQFDATVRRQFPAVAAGVAELPGAVKLVDPVIPRLEHIQRSGDFHRADSIPGLGLPTRSVPWILIALGGAAIAVGAFAFLGPGRLALTGCLALSTAVLVAAFALNLPAKFRSTDRIVSVGRVALSQRAADTATNTVKVVNAMVPEVEKKVIPALASQLHVTPSALTQQLGARFPQVARGLRRWPQIQPGAADLAARQEASVRRFAEGDGIPFRTLPWLLIAPAAVAALLAAVTLVPRRQPALAPLGA
jgi:hypothetical protein